MGDQKTEISKAHFLCLLNSHGKGRRRRLESDREADNLSVGKGLGQTEGVERRIDDADIAPPALAANRSCWEPGTRSISPKVQRVTCGIEANRIA